jgi:MFS family permease
MLYLIKSRPKGETMSYWVKDLTNRERSALWACAGGWALDGFDATIFSYAAPSLIAVQMITKPQAGILGTVALMFSAVGGWIVGLLCDRYGRVLMLQISIAWFAVFTLLCGLAQNFEQLLVFRSLEGLGFGGEWTAGALLMSEVVRAKYRGRAVGTVQAGYGVGVVLASVAYGALLSKLPDEWGWRWLFFVGVLPAAFVFFIRRNVQSDRGPGAAPDQQKGGGPIFAFLAPSFRATTLLSTIAITGAQGAYYGMATWLPLFLKDDRNLSVINTAGYSALVAVGSILGFLIGAHLSDSIGRRMTMILSGITNTACIVAYMVMPLSDFSLLPLGFLLGLTSAARFSPMGALLSELYPSSCRASAVGFIYNLGRGIGAFAPALIGVAVAAWGLGASIAIYVAIGNAMLVFGCMLLPETRGRELIA